MGTENRAGHCTKGDVLEDLGFTAEEIRETEIKLAIWRPLRAQIESRRLTQAQVAVLLQMHQPDASLLVRGKLAKFSITKLMQLAERLELTVRLTVRPTQGARHARLPSSALPARRGKHPLAYSRAQAKSVA